MCLASALIALKIMHNAFIRTVILDSVFLLVAWPALRIYNHLTMATNVPLADASLAKIDAYIGFSWFAYLQFWDKYPVALEIMDTLYQSLTIYIIVIYIFIALSHRGRERCAELLQLFILCGFLCASIGALFPAMTAAAHYTYAENSFLYIQPETGLYHLKSMLALRSDPEHILNINHLPGLVTLPSFHTAMGVVAIYCSRSNPIILLISLAANGTMIASTPIFGSHYGIDIIAGAALAVAAIYSLHTIKSRNIFAGHFRILSSLPAYR